MTVTNAHELAATPVEALGLGDLAMIGHDLPEAVLYTRAAAVADESGLHYQLRATEFGSSEADLDMPQVLAVEGVAHTLRPTSL